MSHTSTVRLGDFAEFVRGISFKPDDVVPLGAPGSVACMRTKNVQAQLDVDDVWAVGQEFVRRDDQFLRPGDVLISSANSWNLVGKCCWIPELPWRSSFGGFVSVLRAASDKVEPRYLYWWFASERTQMILRSFGQKTTNISNLNLDRCLSLDLPLPSRAQQRRIAEVLDRAEALRAKRRKVVSLLDNLIRATFLQSFGDPATNPERWDIVTIADAAECLDRLRKPVKEVDRAQGVVPYYGANGPQGWINRALFDESLVLVAEDGGHFDDPLRGVAYRVDGPAWVNNHAHVLRANPAVVDIEYLHRVLRNYNFTPYISGTTRAKLTQAQMNAARIPVPPLPLQRRFARIVAAIHRVSSTSRSAGLVHKQLFASLQDRAFRGQL